MTATELKGLLLEYILVLRAPGGAESIQQVILDHIVRLDMLEVYGGQVELRDLTWPTHGTPSFPIRVEQFPDVGRIDSER